MTDQTTQNMPMTPAIVADSRNRAANGESIRDLAREHRVTYATLYYAVRGRTWRHVPVKPVTGASHPSPRYAARQVLTTDQVAAARRRVAAGESYQSVSDDMGVSRSAVYDAVTGETHRDMVTPPPVVRKYRR